MVPGRLTGKETPRRLWTWLNALRSHVVSIEPKGDGKTIKVSTTSGGTAISMIRGGRSGGGGGDDNIGMFTFIDVSTDEDMLVDVIDTNDPDGLYAGKLIAGTVTLDVAKGDGEAVTATCYAGIKLRQNVSPDGYFIEYFFSADWPDQDDIYYYDTRAKITVESSRITSIIHIGKRGPVEVAGRVVG